jgi:hypothetical protein
LKEKQEIGKRLVTKCSLSTWVLSFIVLVMILFLAMNKNLLPNIKDKCSKDLELIEYFKKKTRKDDCWMWNGGVGVCYRNFCSRYF